MKDEPLKNYLKNRLGEYTHPVDDELWSSIVDTIPPKRSRKPLYYLISSVAAAIIAGLIFLINFHPTDSLEDMHLTHENQPLFTEIFEDEIIIEEDKPEIIRLKTDLPNAKQITTSKLAQTIQAKEEMESVQSEVLPNDSNEEESPTQVDEQKKEKEINKQEVNRKRYQRAAIIAQPKEKKKTKGFSMQLAMNQTIPNSMTNEGYLMDNAPGDGNLSNETPPPSPYWDEPTYDYPLSFAITARKVITPVVSIESGLMYTYLRTNYNYIDANIKLHYLGIPLKGIFTFYDQRRIMLYATVGGAAEMQISARYNDQTGSKNVRTNDLQWSILGGLGLEIRLSKHTGLYAEPGIVYYFDDNSYIPTIRKDRPLNFNLQVGLRFTIK